MKIHLVNYELNHGIDAILSKYARMLERELIDLGHDVTVSGKPEKADVNHHINFISYKPGKLCGTCIEWENGMITCIGPGCPNRGKHTTMITHLSGDKNQSEKEKIALVKKQLKTSYGICMNEELKAKLVKAGCDEKRLFVSGHAHDSVPRRPLIIAIVTNLYPDGRKNEDVFTKLFKTLDPKDFLFRIMGKNWRPVLDPLVKKHIQVQYMETFTLDLYQQFLCTSDYLLYTGDEDSLAQSVIDAKQAGLRIIARPRKELTVDVPFTTQEELNAIFKGMTENEVEKWTWEKYAQTHEAIWKKL